MNYKAIIKDRRTRQKLLHLFDWVPDEQMIRLQYRVKTGRTLNLRDPKRFTEKLQWLKLYRRDPLMAKCADKVTVREYVADCGLSKILIPLVGVYADESEIDFDKLPDKFVAKDSLGGGNNEVVVCRDKGVLDEETFRNQLREWTVEGRHRKHPGREWVYDCPGRARIVIEEMIAPDDPGDQLVDYKFFFFNGEAKYMYVVSDRVPGAGGKLGIYRIENYELLNVFRADEGKPDGPVSKPANFEAMIEMASRLARSFPHVRVDLYDLGASGGVRFGELTFFDGSGYFKYEPDNFDFEMGREFDVSHAVGIDCRRSQK